MHHKANRIKSEQTTPNRPLRANLIRNNSSFPHPHGYKHKSFATPQNSCILRCQCEVKRDGSSRTLLTCADAETFSSRDGRGGNDTTVLPIGIGYGAGLFDGDIGDMHL